MLKRAIRCVLCLVMMMSVSALAAGKTYDFKDPKGVNSVGFLLDSLLEPIRGVASGVSGKIYFDPENVGRTAGVIEVDVTSMAFSNPKMTEVAMGADWMDAAKFSTVSFTIDKVVNQSKLGENSWLLHVRGTFRCKGHEVPMAVELRVSALPGKAGARMPDAKGDLMLLRSTFQVPMKSVGLPSNDKVADTVELQVAIAGQAE